MTEADWVALGVVAVGALLGLRVGLVASFLSVAGMVVGAVLGARLAPHFLPGGASSAYTPVASLVGAILLAALLQAVGSIAGSLVRGTLRIPPLRALDSAGGALLGAATGLVVVWLVGTIALLLPGQTVLRRDAQSSRVVRELNSVVSPSRLLNLLARVDPFPSITGPSAAVAAPDPALLRDPVVRAAEKSVVRILGTACGLGVEGSGWVARPGLVVTAAHVVAGQHDTTVEEPGTGRRLDASVVVFDRHEDVAVLRVPGLDALPLPIAEPRVGAAVAILGYPEDGPFTATPGRMGKTAVVFSQDAYGHGPVTRTISSLRGLVRHGNSGGPAVDGAGAVETTVFAARIGSRGGFGVPATIVRRDLRRAGGKVSTGHCAG